jgi:hypothetical protein
MANDVMDDPRTTKMLEFVGKLKALYEEYGYRPREVHINPNDDFLSRFQSIGGMKVVKDYMVPRDNLVLL